MLISLVGCGQATSENETLNETYESESPMIENEEEDVPKEVELPDLLFFMTELDPVENSDDTYSFYGCITAYQFSEYSVDPTIYITTLNGREFGTGAAESFRRIYIGNNGETSVILNDILYNSSNVKGIVFKFTYDSDGNLVSITQ